MKKLNLLLIFALFTCAGMAQTQQTQAQPAATVTVPAGETIEHCDAMIKAIDTKVEYITAHADEKAHAEQTGWFEKMARKREIFVARKEYLINHSENH